MFIRPMSDLHLELDSPFLPPVMEEDLDSVLVLAGDIHNGVQALAWIAKIAPRFKHVIYVLGNHDYWQRNHLERLPIKIREELEKMDLPNVSFLHNDSIVVEGVRFLGGTLWTDFEGENPNSLRRAETYMADYIHTLAGAGYRKMLPKDVLLEHKKTKAYLIGKLEQYFGGPTVVVTHHGPSVESVHPKYYYAQGNEYYYSDLEELMYLYQPKYWIHGHTHESRDYVIDQTRVVVNPYGYHGYEVNSDFKAELRLEI